MKEILKKTLWLLCTITLFSIFLLSCSRGVTLYVSPDGDDDAKGTKNRPLKSLEGAKNAVHKLLNNKSNSGGIIVYFENGIYPMEQAVKFTADDSGNKENPIQYKAVDGAIPVFKGSKPLKNWQLLEEGNELQKLGESVQGKIYIADLKEAGICNFGDPIEVGKRPELIFNNEIQTLSRWPDKGFVRAGKVKGTIPNVQHGIHGTKDGIFEYLDEYQNRWAQEPEICLGGYWFWDWSEEFQKVEEWDALTQTVYIREPYHNYGFKDSMRYFGLNLFCELDQPGEWYLNRTTGKIYWYPPEGIEPNNVDVHLTNLDAQYMLEIEDCSFLTFEGLCLQEGRGSAILIKNGNNNLISACKIERFGRDGIHIEDGYSNGVTGCYLSKFGHGGFKIKGGDRGTLSPGGHFVEHTVVEYFSLFKRTYEPAVHLDGCGMRLSNNCFRYSSSSAMRLEGNDFIIEYNQVNNVVTESDDQGGVDMWYNPSYWGNIIRYNHWWDISGGTNHGAAGVRLDDMISGVSIYGNIFEKCGYRNFGAVQIHGGKDNSIDNNLFYKCHAAVSFTPWGQASWERGLDNSVMQKKLFQDIDIRTDIYQEKYPALKNLRKNADVNSIINNLIVDCDQVFLRKNDHQIEENNTVIEAEDYNLEHFCVDEVLAQYGLKPIPFDKIGPKSNKWINQ